MIVLCLLYIYTNINIMKSVPFCVTVELIDRGINTNFVTVTLAQKRSRRAAKSILLLGTELHITGNQTLLPPQ